MFLLIFYPHFGLLHTGELLCVSRQWSGRAEEPRRLRHWGWPWGHHHHHHMSSRGFTTRSHPNPLLSLCYFCFGRCSAAIRYLLWLLKVTVWNQLFSKPPGLSSFALRLQLQSLGVLLSPAGERWGWTDAVKVTAEMSRQWKAAGPSINVPKVHLFAAQLFPTMILRGQSLAGAVEMKGRRRGGDAGGLGRCAPVTVSGTQSPSFESVMWCPAAGGQAGAVARCSQGSQAVVYCNV